MSNDYSNDLIEYAVKNINLAFEQLGEIQPDGEKDNFLKLIIDNTTYITDDYICDLALSDGFRQEMIERMTEKGLIVIEAQNDLESLIKGVISYYTEKKMNDMNWITSPKKQENQDHLKAMVKILVDSMGIKKTIKMIVDLEENTDEI